VINTLYAQAQQIERNQSTKPPLTTSPLLREQNFGIAERKPFGDKTSGVGYFRQSGRVFKFDEGESLDDVRARADKA
jgi:broad specificity phosphatase PhoE